MSSLSDETEPTERPSRFQHYTHAEILLKLDDIERRLTRTESRELERLTEGLADRLTNTGAFFVTLSLAGYTISLALPDSHFGPISMLAGVVGVALIWIGIVKTRGMKKNSRFKDPH